MPSTLSNLERSHASFARLALSTVLALAPAAFATQVAAQETIRFGAPLPLTGALAPEALKQQQGYDLWAEMVNKAGGIDVGGKKMKVEIVYTDYQSNTPRAVQAAEKLITQEKVQFLFSPFGSGATKAASTVSERYGIPTVAATASSSQVYNQGYKYLFGTFTPNETLTNPLTDIVASKAPDVKRVAILARNDLFPLAIANEMDKSAKGHGMEVVFFEKYAINTMDHSSALAQIKAANPQWIFATGYINDLVLIRKQMADQRIEAPVVTMVAGPAYQEYIDATGAGAENVSSAAWWHPAARYKGIDIFGSTESYVKQFQAKYNGTPDYAQASASAAGVIFQIAIEKAGSVDPAKVREALANMNADTFFGPIRFGTTGQINSLEPPVFQIQGGKTVVIHPAAIKQGDLQLGVK
ncbi:MAG: amino acid ABC transporter substrate-binding protein [Burkholderiales bacterium]|nr:MAG: amino acid ABC transporter substrate-binding protein [Burkholderiales bacterium]